jgi:long-chain fatty acid transport protein
MSLISKNLGAVTCTTIFAMFLTPEAHANAFAIREQSTAGMGASSAGEGTPEMGLSAMFWNPAAVTATPGRSAEFSVTYLGPTTRLTAQPGTSSSLLALGSQDSIAKPGIIPATYLGFKINNDWFAGISFDSPYGLSTHADSWAGQQLAMRAEVRAVEVTPVVGFKINDMLSLGAGPRFLWFRGTFSRAALGTAGLPPLAVENVTDDFGYGFIVGATVTPIDNTEIAIGYRSEVKLNLTGHSTFPNSTILGSLSGTQNGIQGDLTLPDQFNLGLRQRIGPISLLGTVEWTGWSALRSAAFAYTSGPAIGTNSATLNFNYRDGWFFSAGAEYQLYPNTIIRSGVGFQSSPITDQSRDTSLPESNRWQISAGLTQKLSESFTLDVAYSFFATPDAQIAIAPGHAEDPLLRGNTLLASTHAFAHAVSLGGRYTW